jgi:hypothetical protein
MTTSVSWPRAREEEEAAEEEGSGGAIAGSAAAAARGGGGARARRAGAAARRGARGARDAIGARGGARAAIANFCVAARAPALNTFACDPTYRFGSKEVLEPENFGLNGKISVWRAEISG